MIITQRQATIGVLLFQAVSSVLGWLFLFFVRDDVMARTALAVAFPVEVGLLVAYWWGWELARYVNLILVTGLVAGPFLDPVNDGSFSPLVFLPSLLAFVAAEPFWIVGLAVVVIGTLIARANGGGIFADLGNLIVFTLNISCLVAGRLIIDQSRQSAEAAAQLAEQARLRAESQAHDLAEQAGLLATRNAEQQRLLSLVSTLETPVVTLAEGVLLAPLVGSLDTTRLRVLTDQVLQAVYVFHTQLVVIDIAGVPEIDSAAAGALTAAARAIRLLGCAVTLSGISAQVAQVLVGQGAGLADMVTVRSPAEALTRFSERG